MMKHKYFSKQLWEQIHQHIDQALNEGPGPYYAAFDADGTLWNTDLGENFFKYQIKNKLIPLPNDPWKFYRDMKSQTDPRPAYLWLAQICRNHSLETVLKWAEDALKELHPLPIFEDQLQLIELLQKKNIEVFVVTASVRWSVIPGAKKFGIPESHVLGVQTQVKNGVITDQQDGPITYQPGKVEALLLKTNGKKPLFCSGNSSGDIHLLEAATHGALAVRAVSPEHELFNAEEKLYQKAILSHWLTHHFGI